MTDPARARRNSWYRLELQIFESIQGARCWYTIEKAVGAMAHARLIWARLDKDMMVHESEADSKSYTPRNTDES